jgi:glycine cleavage system aminomethyltransferase T
MASDRDRFKVTGSADDIATVLVGMFSPTKAQDIALRMLDKLKARKSKAGKADKRGKQMGRPRLSADHVLTPAERQRRYREMYKKPMEVWQVLDNLSRSYWTDSEIS